MVRARRAQRGIDALAPRRDDRGEPVFVGEAKPGDAVVFNRAAFIEVLVIDVEDGLAAEKARRADVVGPAALFVRVGRLAVAVDPAKAARLARRDRKRDVWGKRV